MEVEILQPSGDILISTYVKGDYIKERYSGYSKAQAIARFKRKVSDYKKQSNKKSKKATVKVGRIQKKLNRMNKDGFWDKLGIKF